MVPARLTPRRVLWLVGACLLLLPAFATAADSTAGRHGAIGAVHVARHGHAGPVTAAHPGRRILDDNDNDAESDDLIGDSWLAPCALPQGIAAQSPIAGLPSELQPRRSRALRSFAATDPFAPRPPPVRVQL